MKWINVAERQPSIEWLTIREIKSKVCLDWMYIRKITPEFITATVNEEFGDDDFPSIEYEWLDESPINEDAIMGVLRMGFPFLAASEAYDEIVKIIET